MQGLLIDIGWPGTLGLMKANLKRMDIPLHEIRYAVATHYHVDHAGLAEELKKEGVPLLVPDVQVDAIPLMNKWAGREENYVPITSNGNVMIRCEESRQFLAEIGIAGEILPTPGHTDHCISLLLDDGSVFTGDLPPQDLAWENPTALASWKLLREHGATRVYPGHGPIRPIRKVSGK